MTLFELLDIYNGSDGAATKRLYAHLEAFGMCGLVAMNLFRAQKCSARAKLYRGRKFRDNAYERKQWSMDNLCTALAAHGTELGIGWGWRIDPEQEYHRWVLYIELPTGQVSFHTTVRGTGPDYQADWDGITDASVGRILRWIEELFVDSARRIA